MADIVNRLFREQVAIGFQNLSAQDIAILKHCIPPVSYTHLDVYKRQTYYTVVR